LFQGNHKKEPQSAQDLSASSRVQSKITENLFKELKPFPFIDQIWFTNPCPIKFVANGTTQVNTTLMEGPCIDNCNAQNFAIKEERLDLSTLLEVSSSTEVLHKRSTIVLNDFDLCLDLVVWKLRNRCLNKKKAIEKQMIKVSISQWNAWSVQNETKIQFIQCLKYRVFFTVSPNFTVDNCRQKHFTVDNYR